MITVYTLTYNEEVLMPFMIDHYRTRFPNCRIIIYDNSSTDNTVSIAKDNNCEVRNYNSNNTLNDNLHIQIKNTCWKDADTDWVLVCDFDELLDISEKQLKQEESLGNTKIKTEGWTMINMEDNLNIHDMKYAVRETQYDKDVLFNKKYISEINYGVGCHHSNSVGQIKYSDPYKLYHYKYLSLNIEIAKSKETTRRLSEENKKNGWGLYCMRSETEVIEFWENFKSKAIKIRG